MATIRVTDNAASIHYASKQQCMAKFYQMKVVPFLYNAQTVFFLLQNWSKNPIHNFN